MAVKRFLLLGSLLLSSVLFGFPDQPSHLPKPRPERRKDIIDFNGASHLYFRFTENGKDANRELLDGFWERAHSTAANLAAYNRETRPEVRQTMRLGSSILIADICAIPFASPTPSAASTRWASPITSR